MTSTLTTTLPFFRAAHRFAAVRFTSARLKATPPPSTPSLDVPRHKRPEMPPLARVGGARTAPSNRVTPAAVRRIAAMDDRPILRNLLITQTYHELAHRLADLLGHENANWCAFATWASRSAGAFIRGDLVHQEVEELLDNRRLRARFCDLTSALRNVDCGLDLEVLGIDLPREVAETVALYIGLGNKIVFAELGLLHARFLVTFEGSQQPDPAKLQTFLAQLRPGATLPDAIHLDTRRSTLSCRARGGQDLLRQSFTALYEALWEKNALRKAEKIRLASALAGLHEQIRLGPYLLGALDAPVDELFYSRMSDRLASRLSNRLSDGGREILGLLARAQEVLDHLVQPLGEEIRESFRETSTRLLMCLDVPGDTLDLSKDVPAPPGHSLAPPRLAELDDEPLLEILRAYGAAGRPGRHGLAGWMRERADEALVTMKLRRQRATGTAARDWSVLGQRMRYILAYFRAWQETTRLFETPFDHATTAAIRHGEVPANSNRRRA